MFDYWVHILAIGLPFIQTLFGVALELSIFVLNVSLGLLCLPQFSSQLLLSFELFLLYLPLQILSILPDHVPTIHIFASFCLLQTTNLLFPSLSILQIVLKLLLFLPSFALNLVFQRTLILLFELVPLLCLVSLYFSLFFFKFVNLVIQSFYFHIFDLTQLMSLYLIQFFSLFNLLIDKLLVPILCQLLNDLCINKQYTLLLTILLNLLFFLSFFLQFFHL